MKKYDLVIFGASFLSFGLAKEFKGSSLIIESKAKIGSEFIDSFHGGDGYDTEPDTACANEFKTYIGKCGLLDNVYIPEWTPYIGKWICNNDISVILFTYVIDVKPYNNGYLITVYNRWGKYDIYAKNIVDTRTKTYDKKTFNAIIFGGEFTSFCEEMKVTYIKEGLSIAQLNVDKTDDYKLCRKKIFSIFENRPEGYSHISISACADEFYKRADKEAVVVSDNYKEIYSSYYKNPLLAFDKGAKIGGELNG